MTRGQTAKILTNTSFPAALRPPHRHAHPQLPRHAHPPNPTVTPTPTDTLTPTATPTHTVTGTPPTATPEPTHGQPRPKCH